MRTKQRFPLVGHDGKGHVGKRFGNIINSDSAKLLFKSEGYDPHSPESVKKFHQKASDLVKNLFTILLSARKGKGNGIVVFTGGGNGSGKSTYMNDPQIKNADFVFDSAMVNKEADARSNVIPQAAKALKPGGTAYFTVYEGNGSGRGRQSRKDAWQENRRTADYLEEVKQHFADVTLKDKVITAREPVTDGKLSALATDETFENPLTYSLPRDADFGKDGVDYRRREAPSPRPRKRDGCASRGGKVGTRSDFK